MSPINYYLTRKVPAMLYKLNTFIKEERKRKGITQQFLANKLNCDSQLISCWETCRRRIPESRYKELSGALDIPLSKILELAKNEHIMNNIFHQKFSELYTPLDAMNFISYTLENFEIDSAHKVSLGAILRNYLLLQLIITMLEKETYANQEGDDFIWDYTWFSANIEFAATCQFIESKHAALYEKIVENECTNDLEMIGGRIYEVLQGFIQDMDEKEQRIFRIHLLEYVHHLDDLADGTFNATNHYYCSHFISE